MSTPDPVELTSCPDCGAVNTPEAAKCWLCGRPPVVDIEMVSEEVDSAYRSPTAVTPEGAVVNTASLLLSILVVLVGVGLAMEEPGLAVAYGIVTIPAMLATFVTASRYQAKGKPLGPWGKIVMFIISVVAITGLLGMLAVAAMIAFFIYCLSQL